MNADQHVPVAERELPPEVAARIRTELLAATDVPHRGRRWAPYAAAAAAAGLVAGAVVLTQHSTTDRPPKTKTLEARPPTATPTVISAAVNDPAWQQLALKSCWKANGPLPSAPTAVGHREQDMRFFTGRTLDEQTYVFIGNPSVIMACIVDTDGALIESDWGGLSFGPGPHAETVRAGQVKWGPETMTLGTTDVIGGQAGAGVVRVTVRWTSGPSFTAPVHNGFWVGALSEEDGPVPRSGVGFTVTGYDKNGHVTQTKTVPGNPASVHRTHH